jgi:hypothetical protein
MNKQILIPASSLTTPDTVVFLELSVEPDAERDPYRALGAPGLEGAEATARLALNSLPPAEPPARVRVAADGSGKALTNSSGAALAMTLGPLLLQPGFTYHHYLIMGGLLMPEAGNTRLRPGQIKVSGVRDLPSKLQAIINRGYRVEPALLLLAEEGCDGEVEPLLRALAPLNIAVRRIETLETAYQACGGPLPPARDDTHGLG